MRVLIACEFSGVVRDAFAALGHEAWSCDLLPTERPGNHYKGDVRDAIAGACWDLMIAHPPCTRLANSGVRWLTTPPAGKTAEQLWAEFAAAVDFYQIFRAANVPLKAIENPVMHCYARERLGKVKRQTVQPWWFGEPQFKATGFELHGLPELVASDRLVPPKKGTPEHKAWSVVHRESPGPNRWKNRSRTLPGVARALAEQWGVVCPA